MKKLNVFIEIKGDMRLVGCIVGNDYRDAYFTYDHTYLDNSDNRPISVRLPLQEDAYSPTQTQNFFEGLLPEGFSRRAVANWAKVSEDDYLAILEKLGRECLGAILVLADGESLEEGEYKKLTLEEVRKLAAEGATKSTAILMETHLSLTGASGKVGLYRDEDKDEWYLPTGRMASTHIVKQSHVRLDGIVFNEYFCMKVASKLGIEVPEVSIINVGNGRDDEILYATKRYDRVKDYVSDTGDLSRPYRLHQEDFSQALGIPASEKYENENKSYLRKMFDLIRKVSANPIEDQMRLWDMIIVNYLLGNTDCHIKNYSLLYSDDLKSIRLAPAYDIVCTRAYGTTPNMSLYIGGEININKINRDSFAIAAREVGLGERLAMQHFDELCEKLVGVVQDVAEEMDMYMNADTAFIKKAIMKKYEK